MAKLKNIKFQIACLIPLLYLFIPKPSIFSNKELDKYWIMGTWKNEWINIQNYVSSQIFMVVFNFYKSEKRFLEIFVFYLKGFKLTSNFKVFLKLSYITEL